MNLELAEKAKALCNNLDYLDYKIDETEEKLIIERKRLSGVTKEQKVYVMKDISRLEGYLRGLKTELIDTVESLECL